MSWSRRRLLGVAGMLAWASAAGLRGTAGAAQNAVGAQSSATRRIALRNVHTGEALDVVFRRGDEYVAEAMSAIQAHLRDYRSGAQHPVDPALMDYLYEVAQHAGVEPVFTVISGYRSPQTNAMLRERSSGVSSHSLHMEGRAIDVRLAGVDCARLSDEALHLRRGGVGYYGKSDFVHLDTGRFRTWRG